MDLTIVTAASSNHFRPLLNLLYTLDTFEAGSRVIVYDLGLEALDQLHARELRRFPFEKYPRHVALDARSYAWKPIIVAEVLGEVAGPVLWLDAGDLVYEPLLRVRAVLEREGFYCPKGSGTVGEWTHPVTLRALEAAAELLHQPARNAAIVGVTPQVGGLVDVWRAAALDPNIITPAGSSRDNHRQDQAVLTVLAYQFARRQGFALEDARLGISHHNDRATAEEVRRRLCSSG